MKQLILLLTVLRTALASLVTKFTANWRSYFWMLLITITE